MEPYDHKKIEKKWQEKWEADQTFRADDNSLKPKFYGLIEFPYPSGAGMHLGHIRSNTAMDVITRKRRMEGHEVLYPIGWDAFGLPTENYAIKVNRPPAEITKENTSNFRRQLKACGFSFDWSREVDTTDPRYYKWTQWIFLQLLKAGLAYKTKMPINWCLTCKIGLANEEVVAGRCERDGGPTEKREKEQWMLAITKYADRLDKDLDKVNFLEKIKIQQRNWIGRSEGVLITYPVVGQDAKITVFTTRHDTNYGASFVAVAPDGEFIRTHIDKLPNAKEVDVYVAQAAKATDMERTAEDKEKTGVFTGWYVHHPLTDKQLPIYVSDFVLGHVGTGALVGVPAHDKRDYDFAQKFGLPIEIVLEPVTGTPLPDEEDRKSIVAIIRNPKDDTYLSINWGKEMGGNIFIGGGREEGEDPLATALREIKEETGYLHVKHTGTSETVHHHYRAHSKNVNRNIEVIGFSFDLIDDARIPEKLEADEAGKFTVEWLSKQAAEDKVKDPLHQYLFQKFYNNGIWTEDGILTNSGKHSGLPSAIARERIREALGAEAHVAYKLRDWVFSRQRYWGEPIPVVHCLLCGIVPLSEDELPLVLPPVEKYQPTETGESPLAAIEEWVNTVCPTCGGSAKRETDTMPNWAGSSWYFLRYIDPHNEDTFAAPEKLKHWLPIDWYNGGMEHTTLHLLYSRFWHKFLFDQGLVPADEPYAKRTSHGLILAEDGAKMSKSKGNGASPDDLIERFGADALRLCEMFMAPFDQAVPWNSATMVGVYRFLEKVWRVQDKIGQAAVTPELERLIHQTIKKVGEDIEEMKFNTAVSSLMILVNEMEKQTVVRKEDYEKLLLLLSGFAPHIAEELWHGLGNANYTHEAPWPTYDSKKLAGGSSCITVQVNGKVRAQFETAEIMTESQALQKAQGLPQIAKWLQDKAIAKVIYIPQKLVNIVTLDRS